MKGRVHTAAIASVPEHFVYPCSRSDEPTQDEIWKLIRLAMPGGTAPASKRSKLVNDTLNYIHDMRALRSAIELGEVKARRDHLAAIRILGQLRSRQVPLSGAGTIFHMQPDPHKVHDVVLPGLPDLVALISNADLSEDAMRSILHVSAARYEDTLVFPVMKLEGQVALGDWWAVERDPSNHHTHQDRGRPRIRLD